MEKNDRARIIVDQVLSKEAKFGRIGPPRNSKIQIPCRLISDNPRWEARLTRGYEKDPAGGEPWDLFELFIYNQHRVTAVVRGEELTVRYYLPGVWEPIFLPFDPKDTVPLKPN